MATSVDRETIRCILRQYREVGGGGRVEGAGRTFGTMSEIILAGVSSVKSWVGIWLVFMLCEDPIYFWFHQQVSRGIDELVSVHNVGTRDSLMAVLGRWRGWGFELVRGEGVMQAGLVDVRSYHLMRKKK